MEGDRPIDVLVQVRRGPEVKNAVGPEEEPERARVGFRHSQFTQDRDGGIWYLARRDRGAPNMGKPRPLVKDEIGGET